MEIYSLFPASTIIRQNRNSENIQFLSFSRYATSRTTKTELIKYRLNYDLQLMKLAVQRNLENEKLLMISSLCNQSYNGSGIRKGFEFQSGEFHNPNNK